jgi:phasin
LSYRAGRHREYARLFGRRAQEVPSKAPAQFEDLATETKVPEAMRDLAEKNIAQTREVYERYKDAVEATLETLEKSFATAGQGTTALNRKFTDILRRNIDSGFDLAKSLAGAKTLADAMEVQAAYWHKQLDALAAQAEEMRTLSAQVTADTAEPITAHLARGMEELRKAG